MTGKTKSWLAASIGLCLAWSVAAQVVGQHYGNETGVMGHKKLPLPDKAAKKSNLGEIRGRCIIVAGGGNLVEVPCADTTLILNTKKGDEFLKTRTDRAGNFEFSIEAEESLDGKKDTEFRIVSGTRFYEVVSPTETIRVGQNIELKLRQK